MSSLFRNSALETVFVRYPPKYFQDTLTKLDSPCLTNPLRCDRAFLVGQRGLAAIVCDTLVQQGHCYTYLATGGPILPGTLRPPHGVPKPPRNKKEIQKTPKTPLVPKSKRYFPKSKRYFPKAKRYFPVKYFMGIFEAFKVFEIFCWGVTLTGVSKRYFWKRMQRLLFARRSVSPPQVVT